MLKVSNYTCFFEVNIRYHHPIEHIETIVVEY